MMKTKSLMKKVRSLYELRSLAGTDPRYARLAIVAAKNLGGNADTLDQAMAWLRLNANETGSEAGVVKEVNGCRDLVPGEGST